jgi:hypothetical protein
MNEITPEINNRLEAIEAALEALVNRPVVKEYYSVAEIAGLLGKAAFTVREWCRLGRVHAEKRRTGRGNSRDWMISHEELERIRNFGLLPQED